MRWQLASRQSPPVSRRNGPRTAHVQLPQKHQRERIIERTIPRNSDTRLLNSVEHRVLEDLQVDMCERLKFDAIPSDACFSE